MSVRGQKGQMIHLLTDKEDTIEEEKEMYAKRKHICSLNKWEGQQMQYKMTRGECLTIKLMQGLLFLSSLEQN